jgi:glycosyltransferase involved in cell wall biosynthesis
MTERAPVSVIIAAYNAALFLAEAIESAISQTWPPLEILVADDGSTDETAHVAARFQDKIRYLHQDHAGAAAARNLAISKARGEFLAPLDADDLWLPEKLALQMAAFAEDPTLDIVSGHIVEFRIQGDGAMRERAAAPGVVVSSTVVRASAFHRVGPLRTDLKLGEFIDWGARAFELGLKQHILPQTVVRRRIHASNSGIQSANHLQDYVTVVRDALLRRRQSGKSPGVLS